MQIVTEAKMSVADYDKLDVLELKSCLLPPQCCPHCGATGCLNYWGFMSDTSVAMGAVFGSRFYVFTVSKPELP